MPSAGGIRAGRAFVELYLKDQLPRGLRSASKRMRTFAAGVGAIGAKIAAGAGAAAAAAIVPAITAASRMEETMNKFNVVFGSNAGEVKKWGDAFGDQVGRSKQQVADFLASSQDLFVPLGFDEQSATAMSKQLATLAVDLASFNNLNDADVLRDLQAAMTGSGEVMKKYGVLVQEAEVKQELLNQGLDPKTATNQQKVMARLNIILRGTTAAQGDAVRSSGSFANQQKRLMAVLDDTAVAVGTALLPQVTQLVTWFADAVKVAGEWASNNSGLIVSIAQLVGIVGAVGVGLIAIAGAATAASAVFSGLATVAGVLGTAISAVGAVLGVVVSPIGLVVAALALAVAWFANAAEHGLSFASNVAEVFGQAWGGVLAALKSGDLGAAASIAWAGLKTVWAEGLAAVQSMWADFQANLISTFTRAMSFIQSKWVETQKFAADSLLKIAAQGGVLGKAASLLIGTDVEKMVQEGNGLEDERRQAARANIEEAIGIKDNEIAQAERRGASDDELARMRRGRDNLQADLDKIDAAGPANTLKTATDQVNQKFDAELEKINQETEAFLATVADQARVAKENARAQADRARADLTRKTDAAQEAAAKQEVKDAGDAASDPAAEAAAQMAAALAQAQAGANAAATAAGSEAFTTSGTFSAHLAGQGADRADRYQEEIARNTLRQLGFAEKQIKLMESLNKIFGNQETAPAVV